MCSYRSTKLVEMNFELSVNGFYFICNLVVPLVILILMLKHGKTDYLSKNEVALSNILMLLGYLLINCKGFSLV